MVRKMKRTKIKVRVISERDGNADEEENKERKEGRGERCGVKQ